MNCCFEQPQGIETSIKTNSWSSNDDPKPEHIEIIGFSMRKMRFANKLLTVDS